MAPLVSYAGQVEVPKRTVMVAILEGIGKQKRFRLLYVSGVGRSTCQCVAALHNFCPGAEASGLNIRNIAHLRLETGVAKMKV